MPFSSDAIGLQATEGPQRGQALLEYVLLIAIIVGFGVTLFTLVAGQNSSVRKAWIQILCQIGADDPNSTSQPDIQDCIK